MPSLFALLHFNTQARKKLPAEGFMQPPLHLRAGSFAEWKKPNDGDRVGYPGATLLMATS